MTKLNAKARDSKISREELFKKGEFPAVYYGHKKESTSISVSEIEFKKALKEAGESSTIELVTENGTIDALIHDVQADAVTGRPIHADFLIVDANKEIEVGVPLEFTGEAPAVKGNIGTLMKIMHEVEIRALPKNLPHGIEVSIENLTELHQSIHAKDLILPKGVSLVTGEDEVIASIAEMKEEKEEEALPIDLSAIEVEKKGKKEDEGEEPAKSE